MKNYDEITNELIERRDEYLKKQKSKKESLLKITCSVGGLCMACLICMGIIMNNDETVYEPEVPNDFPVDGEKEVNSDMNEYNPLIIPEDPNSVDANDVCKILFYTNVIQEKLSAAPKYLAPDKHYTVTWSDEMAIDYLGIDLSEISHQSLSLKSKCAVLESSNHTVYYTNEGVLVRDILYFEYEFPNGIITVSASKLGLPYDCLYYSDTEISTPIGTDNGSVYVKFFGTEDVASDSEPSLRELHVADFQFNGVNFRVTAENMYSRDFYDFVSGIVNK